MVAQAWTLTGAGSRLAWRRWLGGCAAALAMALWGMVPAQAGDEGRYGKRLEQSSTLPAADLARLLQFQTRMQREGKPNTGLLAATEKWAAEVLFTTPKDNPYTLVVRVRGVALADGPVSSRWQTAWGLEDGSSRNSLLPELVKAGTRAGESVELVGVSPPISFKEVRKVAPIVEFMALHNLRMDEVRVEVWSGLRKTSWLEGLGAGIPLLTGLVFLGLFWWWRGR